MTNHDGAVPIGMPTPDPALRRLDPLVGTWTIAGRTLGAEQDDVTGTVTIDWLPGGFFLQLRGELRVERMEVQSLEVVHYDPSTGAFASGTPIRSRPARRGARSGLFGEDPGGPAG